MNNYSSMDCVNRQDVVKILILPTACVYRTTREVKSYLKEKEMIERQHSVKQLRQSHN